MQPERHHGCSKVPCHCTYFAINAKYRPQARRRASGPKTAYFCRWHIFIAIFAYLGIFCIFCCNFCILGLYFLHIQFLKFCIKLFAYFCIFLAYFWYMFCIFCQLYASHCSGPLPVTRQRQPTATDRRRSRPPSRRRPPPPPATDRGHTTAAAASSRPLSPPQDRRLPAAAAGGSRPRTAACCLLPAGTMGDAGASSTTGLAAAAVGVAASWRSWLQLEATASHCRPLAVCCCLLPPTTDPSRCWQLQPAVDLRRPPAAGGNDGQCWSYLDDRTCCEPAAAPAGYRPRSRFTRASVLGISGLPSSSLLLTKKLHLKKSALAIHIC